MITCFSGAVINSPLPLLFLPFRKTPIHHSRSATIATAKMKWLPLPRLPHRTTSCLVSAARYISVLPPPLPSNSRKGVRAATCTPPPHWKLQHAGRNLDYGDGWQGRGRERHFTAPVSSLPPPHQRVPPPPSSSSYGRQEPSQTGRPGTPRGEACSHLPLLPWSRADMPRGEALHTAPKGAQEIWNQ